MCKIDSASSFSWKPADYILNTVNEMLEKASAIGAGTASIARIGCDAELILVCCKLQIFLRLAQTYSPSRLEAACRRAIFYKAEYIPLIELVLKKKSDYLPLTHSTDIFGNKILS